MFTSEKPINRNDIQLSEWSENKHSKLDVVKIPYNRQLLFSLYGEIRLVQRPEYTFFVLLICLIIDRWTKQDGSPLGGRAFLLNEIPCIRRSLNFIQEISDNAVRGTMSILSRCFFVRLHRMSPTNRYTAYQIPMMS